MATERSSAVERHLEAMLESLVPGVRVSGLVGTQQVTVQAIRWISPQALRVWFTHDDGRSGDTLAFRDHEAGLHIQQRGRAKAFDADPRDYKLAAEALRIRNAARFDPMLAVSTSDVEPLPHQLKAVYGELLPRTPLRFLLADDPGAGKTVMAGLYIKELFLRADLARCLVVAPGSLVEQWQEELLEKFGLRFDVLTRDMISADVDGTLFTRHPLLIARMDQLSRSEDLQDALQASDWDLVVVDEAHRMSAHYYGNELKRTRRYQLGELLGRISRHLLLMTATPHAGKEEDFQLFMALLDSDRFEGKFRDGVHAVDSAGLMRRMVKEDLLTFAGTPLFPERRAQTVPYQLSPAEAELYEAVTQYVREEMNRAERVGQDGDRKRSTTVGFALTVLQRRLASSPEAIWRSLERRRRRLERRRQEMDSLAARDDEPLNARLSRLLGRSPAALADALADDLEDLDASEQEDLAEEVVDAATAARTVAELDLEIRVLADLEGVARQVRHSDTDRKWVELRSLLTGAPEVRAPDGSFRKIIVFTEHRDTLAYLVEKIRSLLGRDEAVVAIHGGVRREDRRKAQELFSGDPAVQVLVATDAAGEGLNLQRAHLMVNYDLPWNPNRIEQRFGRIHRIGQTEVCHLWNLVAVDTREGAVFQRLLEKVDEQRRAYSGQVFDVLGEAFADIPLRDLLVQAIRYGDQPAVRAQLSKVIDATVGDGIAELMAERALHRNAAAGTDVTEMRLQMEQARARRLQPHYVAAFFLEAIRLLGGRMIEREPGRWQVEHVPSLLRERDRQIGTRAPLLAAYERVTFNRDLLRVLGLPPAQLVAPGHPLLDAVIDVVVERNGSALRHGTVLVDTQDSGTTPRLSVAVESEVVDGSPVPSGRHVVSRRFEFVDLHPDGTASPAGPAPYLDLAEPSDHPTIAKMLAEQVEAHWLAAGVDDLAMAWAVDDGGRRHLREVTAVVGTETARTRAQVRQRLEQEINHWDTRAMDLQDRVAQGREVRLSPQTAAKRARDLEARLARRLTELDDAVALELRPPRVAAAALVLPQGLLDAATGTAAPPTLARETERVERRAVDAVLAAERALGREPHEQAHNHPGFDVLSLGPDGSAVTIEVKGRVLGAADVVITRTEILTGKTKGREHRLALVAVHPDRPGRDEIRYLVDPFAAEPDPSFFTDKVTMNWRRLWEAGGAPQ